MTLNKDPIIISFAVIVSMLLISACAEKKQLASEKHCVVNFDSLMRKIDMAALDMDRLDDGDSVEVRDSMVRHGVGGVFHFDSKGRLGLYAFMYDWPHTSFMIRYDSNGKKERMQDREVVQWQYQKKDSTGNKNLTILLCALDRNYGSLQLTTGSFTDSSIQLFETTYAKIICFTSVIPVTNNSDSIKLWLRGESMEKCSGEIRSFIDSTTIETL